MPSLDFKGKAFVNAHHLTVPFRELVPDAKKSCLPKGTAPALDGNLIIHGDNLHALKALLPLYAGKVDCVFIDPPYNTGNEGWCYNDNVRSPVAKEWLKKASPVDKEDLERHDKWACMMTAERVRRVIRGYPFSGTKRTELMREPINWTKLKKADALVEKAESIKPLEGADYDEVKITVEAGELVVTGEMTIKDKAPGIPGAFTYCTLGAEMSLEGLLTGKDLPAFEALAKYVFYTATGRTLATVVKQPTKGGDGLIGEVEHYRVHLIYQPDQAWLRSEAAVLTETKVEAIVAGRPAGQRSLVFAAAKYLSQKDLTGRGVEFCQLPYAIHRILGESAPRV